MEKFKYPQRNIYIVVIPYRKSMKSKSKKCNIIPPIVEKEKRKEEGLTEKLIFKVTPAMRRAVEIVSRELGITMGDLLRAGTAYFLSRYEDILDKEVVEAMKRESLRRATLSKPEEYLEGLEIINNLKKRIEICLNEAAREGTIKPEIFDYFLRMVEENRDVVKNHREAEFLLSEIDRLKKWLELRKKVFVETGML